MNALMKIYTFSEANSPSIHKWIVGELLSRPTFGPVYTPFNGFNYYPLSVRAKGYRIGSPSAETIWFTPYFFSNYEDIYFNDPWYLDVLSESGELLWRGIIDPDSIEYEFRSRETKFTATNPLFAIEKLPPIGTRDAYAVRPINVLRQMTSNSILLAIDVPKGAAYDTWIANGPHYIEYEGGFFRTSSIEDRGSAWRLITNSVPVEQTIYVSARLEQISTNASRNSITAATFSFTPPETGTQTWSRADSLALYVGANRYFYTTFKFTFVYLQNTISRAITIENVNLPIGSLSVGSYYTIALFIHKADTSLQENLGEIFILRAQPNTTPANYGGSISGAPASAVIQAILSATLAPFSNSPAPIDEVGARVRPETLLSQAPKEAIESLLNLGPSMLYVEPTTSANFRLVFKSLPSPSASATTTATALTLKTSPTRRRPSGVRILYAGENKQRGHYGIYPSRPDRSLAGEGLSLKVAWPAIDIVQTATGAKESISMSKIAESIYNFLATATIETTGEILPDSPSWLYKSLAGQMVQINIETFDHQGNTSIVAQKYFVLRDEIDPSTGIRRATLLSPATVPLPSRRPLIAAPSVALSTVRLFLIVYHTHETPSSSTWIVRNESGGVVHSETHTGADDIYYFDYNPNASYAGPVRSVEVQVTFSPTGNTATSDRVLITRPTPPATPIDVPILPLAETAPRGPSSTTTELRLTQGALSIGASLEAAPVTPINPINNGDFTGNINGWSVSANDTQFFFTWASTTSAFGFDAGSFEFRFVRDASITMTAAPTASAYQVLSLPAGTENTYATFEAAGFHPPQSFFTSLRIRIYNEANGAVLKEKYISGATPSLQSIRFKVPSSRQVRIEFTWQEPEYSLLNTDPNGTTYRFFIIGCRLSVLDAVLSEYTAEGLRLRTPIGTTEISNKNANAELIRTSAFTFDILATDSSDRQDAGPPPPNSARLYYDGALRVALVDARGNVTVKTINVS